jgi:D-glycero-D-manno-heptose 1,7-bisphosphate phosphatase
MRKVVFLDRDGVINRERGDYTYKIEDFELNPGLIEALQHWQRENYAFIVITNQGGIAKGLYNHADVQRLHQHMLKLLRENNVEVLDVYYCPHHDTVSRCLCRKPGSLLIEKAVACHDVDIEQSFMIGDRDRDVKAAEGLGLRGAKVESNSDLSKIKFHW